MAERHAGAVHAREDEGDEARRVRCCREDTGHASTAAVAASPGAAFAPSTVLHDHALQSIFLFFGLNELATVSCVSKAWRSVVCDKMPSAGLRLHLWGRTFPAAAGPLARHVGVLDCSQHSPTAVQLLSLTQPNWCSLRVLVVWLNGEAAQAVTFPPTLHALVLHFREDVTQEQGARVVEAASQLPELETLELGKGHRVRSVVCLQRVASLRTLRMCQIDTDATAFLDELRLLTQLHTLTIPLAPAPCIEHLLRPPHQLQLRDFGYLRLDDTVSATLLSLPTIQKLAAANLSCSNFVFVSQLPQLRDLSFDLLELSAASRAALLASASAGHFARITNLTLQCCLLQADDLSSLFLAGMPQLSKICLFSWLKLNSLGFLATPQLQASLTELALINCRALPPSELEHVYGLKQLCTLTLTGSFNAPLPKAVWQELEPAHCMHLPLLRRFEY